MFDVFRRHLLGLDPARSLRRIAEYDIERGYDDFAATCRAQASAAAAPANDAELVAAHEMQTRGIACLDVLPPGRAAELRRRLVELPAIPPRNPDADFNDTFDLPADLMRELVEASLPAPVAAAIARHFGSHFFVYGAHATRLRPGTASKRSLLWHCDSGPTRHLKLLVYLEDSRATGGNTAFLDRPVSDGFLAAGYTFGPLRRRRHDLAGLGRRLGLSVEPRCCNPTAGQGLLFEPSRVLHRGVVPERAPRHVFTLVLLPSPRPWAAVQAARHGLTPVFDGRFPMQAKHLLADI